MNSLKGNANKKEETPSWLILISILIATGIFLLDLSIPLGVAAGVPYVVLVLISLWSPKKQYTYLMAITGTLLTFAGFFFSPAGGEMWKVLFNRFLALFVIWITTILSLQHKKAEEDLRTAYDKLKKQIKERIEEIEKSDEKLK